MSFLDSQQVADHLGITTRTVTNMFNRGDIPGAFKVGHVWRIAENDFMTYLKGLGDYPVDKLKDS